MCFITHPSPSCTLRGATKFHTGPQTYCTTAWLCFDWTNVRICFFHNISFTVQFLVPWTCMFPKLFLFCRFGSRVTDPPICTCEFILIIIRYHIFLISFWDLISFHDFDCLVPFSDVTPALTDIAGVACTCDAAICGPSSQRCARGTGGTGTSFPCPSKPLWARTIVRSLTRKSKCISPCW